VSRAAEKRRLTYGIGNGGVAIVWRASLVFVAIVGLIGLLTWLVTLSVEVNVRGVGAQSGGEQTDSNSVQLAQMVQSTSLDKSELRTLPKGNPEAFAKLLREVPRGTLAVRTPDEMRLGDRADIEVLLAPDPKALRETVALGMRNPRLALERLRLGDTITATIEAPGFDVTGETSQALSTGRGLALAWFWNVRAIEPGNQRLTFAFDVPTELDGVTEVRRVRTMVRTIAVSEPLLTRVARLLSGFWWAFAIVLVAAALGLVRPWRFFQPKEA